MQILWWILGILGLVFLLYMAAAVYLATVLRWEDEQTVGLNYYGRPPVVIKYRHGHGHGHRHGYRH